ncbi:MAG: winged helix-turn-helix domain-containing protein [Vicinamibacteraceae bacterium]
MTSTSLPRVRFYRFGPHTVDPLKGLLWRDDALIPLTPRSFEVLVALIENRGRLIEKDELLKWVWPNTVVEENNLARHICTLRKALQERPDQHEYIVTVPGHGYRFVAQVVEAGEPVDGHPEAVAHAPTAREVKHAPSTAPAEVAAHPRHSTAASVRLWPGRAMLAVAIAAAGVISTLVALDGPRSGTPAPPRPLRQLTYEPGLQHEPSWSPDGQQVAYTSDRAGSSDVWVQALDTPSPFRVTSSPAHDWQPDWSPDGKWLAFRSERAGGGIYVISPRSGAERRIADFGYRPRWSPDGSRILFSSSGLYLSVPPRMYVVGLDGRPPRPVRNDLMTEFRSVAVGWHPDSERVSIWGRRETGWSFLTAPVAGGPATVSAISPAVARQLDEADVTLSRFVWSPSGRYLYFEGESEHVRNLWRLTVDPRTLAWIGGPERLTTGVGDDTGIALSPDGTKLAFSGQSANTRLWAFPFDPATSRLAHPGTPVTSGAMDVLNFDAPADGRRLVYRTIRAGQYELWEQLLDDGRERLVIGGHGWTRAGPTWSNDGSYLAYFRGPTSPEGSRAEQAVAVLPIDSGVEHLLTTPGQLTLIPTDWSHDGTLILGSCRYPKARRSSTCVLPVRSAPHAEHRVRLVASAPTKNLHEQRFSPNQRWISFNAVDATDASISGIHVVATSGGPWTAITDGRAFDDAPRWAPDGRTLYFVSNRSGFLNVWGRRFDPTSGVPVGDQFQVTSFDGPEQMLTPHMERIGLVISSHRLVVPIIETSGRIWILDNVNR